MGQVSRASLQAGIASQFLLAKLCPRLLTPRPSLYHCLTLQGGDILSKYVALYAAELIKSNAALSALKLFNKYGAPPNPQVGIAA